MIKVSCRTNLDLRGEEWPNFMPSVPNVGDRIQSATKHMNGFQLELEVCRVTWKKRKCFDDSYSRQLEEWIPEIELHMTTMHKEMLPSRDRIGRIFKDYDDLVRSKGSIIAFYDWYAPRIGTTASAFI